MMVGCGVHHQLMVMVLAGQLLMVVLLLLLLYLSLLLLLQQSQVGQLLLLVLEEDLLLLHLVLLQLRGIEEDLLDTVGGCSGGRGRRTNRAWLMVLGLGQREASGRWVIGDRLSRLEQLLLLLCNLLMMMIAGGWIGGR